MNTIAIFPESPVNPSGPFLAVSGDRLGIGMTAGQALDALTSQLEPTQGTIVVIQTQRPDEYFSESQISQLKALMSKWRIARDTGSNLDAKETEELENLIEAELQAAIKRTQQMKNPA